MSLTKQIESPPAWATSINAILRKARDDYAEHPSHAPRGTFTNHCPVRCIDRAGDGWYEPAAERALIEAAGLTAEGHVDKRLAIIGWNADATTEEVLAAFDRAIEATA